MLDTLVPNRPARIVSYDGHTAWVNTRALKLAGITRLTPNPANGAIVKDPRTGEPTGVLKESAMSLVNRVVPTPTREDRARALRLAVTAGAALRRHERAGGGWDGRGSRALRRSRSRPRAWGSPLRCALDDRRTGRGLSRQGRADPREVCGRRAVQGRRVEDRPRRRHRIAYGRDARALREPNRHRCSQHRARRSQPRCPPRRCARLAGDDACHRRSRRSGWRSTPTHMPRARMPCLRAAGDIASSISRPSTRRISDGSVRSASLPRCSRITATRVPLRSSCGRGISATSARRAGGPIAASPAGRVASRSAATGRSCR